MTVTELLTRNSSNSAPIKVHSDHEGAFNFPPGIGTGDPFLDGVNLHAALRLLRHETPGRFAHHHRLWPVLRSIRNAAHEFGAVRLIPEVTVKRSGLIGRVDLRAIGAHSVGQIEIKVVARLPDAPRQRDLRQAALYLTLATRRPPAWAALIYLSMSDGRARYFVFTRAVSSLMRSATTMSRN